MFPAEVNIWCKKILVAANIHISPQGKQQTPFKYVLPDLIVNKKTVSKPLFINQ